MQLCTSIKTNFGQLLQGDLTITILLHSPIDVVVLMSHGHQDIEGAVAGRRQGWIGDTGVLDVKRWVGRENVPLLDILQVAAVKRSDM